MYQFVYLKYNCTVIVFDKYSRTEFGSFKKDQTGDLKLSDSQRAL